MAPVLKANVGGAVLADSYVVPPRPPTVRPMLVPSTQLANYVVAHSMVSSPVAGRNLLSAFIGEQPPVQLDDPKINVAANAK